MKYRRRREGRTNYRHRLKLLLSRRPRLVIRKGNNQIVCQVIEYNPDGDRVIASANSHELKKFGWNGHPGNVPSAYLTGYLCGKRFSRKDLVVLDAIHPSEAIYAAAKGFVDSGCNLPFNVELKERRIQGYHIQDYAKELKAKDEEAFRRQFSRNVENIVEDFKEVKKKIGEING